MARRVPKAKPGHHKTSPADRPGLDHKPQVLRKPLPLNSERIPQILASIEGGALSVRNIAKLYSTSTSQVRRLKNFGAAFITRSK